MALLTSIISLIAPHDCLSCGVEGPLVCNYCFPDFCSPLPPRCYLCKAITTNSAVCHKCRRTSKLRHIWVSADYDQNAKRLVHTFKFRGAQDAAPYIARFMYAALPYLENVLLVPIPTATMRIRQRGYDHTRLLARQLSRLTGLSAMSCLARIGQTRQVGSKSTVRRLQLEGAFWVKRPRLVKDAQILLIDDITTTGATLETAAQVLKQAGAKTVDAVVFAQKLKV